MAYTVGVLCRSPMPVDLAAVLDDLLSHTGIIRNGRRSEGDDWCACDVQFGQSQWLTTLEVSRVAAHLTALVESAAADGFALDASRGDCFAIDLTLSGDVDWPPIVAFLGRVIEQHHGLLYDEVAGFKATLT